MDVLVFIVGFIVGVFALYFGFQHWCKFGTYSVYDAESNRYLDIELDKKIIKPNANTLIVLVPRKQKKD